MTRFIAIDWGTSNRRDYLIESGRVLATSSERQGALDMSAQDYAATIADLRARHGDLPVLIAGMAGSNRGWRMAPYIDVPARPEALAGALLWVEPGRTAIIPGVAQRDRAAPSVMRGEEVQLFGALAAGLVPADALLAQPGTHNKWVEMRGGAIDRFSTVMTGELFALLKHHSVLAPQLVGEAVPGAAFDEGVHASRTKILTAALFETRAAMVLGLHPDRGAASYVSGLLIGADVAAGRVEGRDAYIIADPRLGALYHAAVAHYGGTAHLIDSVACFVGGVTLIRELSR